ncbi:MAG TPA: sensor histidine kinase [Terracidiphilus sp.]|nr:sensor histidine kinase [Terracidiphilus sp.]
MTTPAEPTNCEPPKERNGRIAAFVRHVWIIPAAALLIVLLFLSVGRSHVSEVGREFLNSLTYCAMIAVPSTYLLTWSSIRYSGRYPRLVYLLHSFTLLVTATAGSFAAAWILEVFHLIPRGAFWEEFRESYPFAVVISQVIGLSMTSFETMRHKLQSATIELRTRQVEQERANKLMAEARLSSLESRIQPHFLFNTLNSIASLIPSDPQRAEDTVARLAALLRFSLNANHSSLVPLAQELKIVRDYLEIESTRFGSRLHYEIAVPESLNGFRVPPLAIQTLVENSIKHVVAQRTEGGTIRVCGRKDDGLLRFEVVDDGPGFSLAEISPEHGLGNLAARLQLLFGDRGQLEATRDNNRTVVRIVVPAGS